jgi:hypothetical protein
MLPMRTDDDYEVRLTERVRQWESKHAADAERVRIETRRKLGVLKAPPNGSLRWLVVERAFRDAVRDMMGWPTADQWIRGDAA